MRVFISYSHDTPEHKQRVLGLSERLRADGIETLLDQYLVGAPAQGWPRWMLDQLDAAERVLVVCTPTYYRRFRGHGEPGRGKGVDWEGALITQEIYDSRSTTLKFLPVFLSEPDTACIPEPLRAGTHYAAHTDDGYGQLYDVLLGQGAPLPGPVGTPRVKPREHAAPLALEPAPRTGSRLALIAGGAALAAAGMGYALWGRTPAPAPAPAAQAPAVQPGPQRVTLEMVFEPDTSNGPVEGELDPKVTIDVPDNEGPLAFVDAGGKLRHAGFPLPPPGQKLSGSVQRKVFGSEKIKDGQRETVLCLKVERAVPADTVLPLRCVEHKGCTPAGDAVSACPGRTALNLFDWLPSAHAADPATMQRDEWLVPTLATLKARQAGARPAAYSAVSLSLDPPPGVDQADAVAYELSINGKRLWVDALPTWALGQPWKPGQPLEIAFGLENLDAAGNDDGREQLNVKLVFLAQRKPIATDTVTLPYTALRKQPSTEARTERGVPLRWSAVYHPTQADRYQILLYGGGQKDTLDARAKLRRAEVNAADGAALVGVLRPPLPGRSTGWGLAAGTVLPSGQIRFSFDGAAAQALCQHLMAPAQAQKLRPQGFRQPGAEFRVRVIAETNEEDAAGRVAPKPLVPCASFSPA